MSYRRVLPRDLFNEAKLLKCLGQLSLLLHNEVGIRWPLKLVHEPEGAFRIEQDASDGGLLCTNVTLTLNRRKIELLTCLNSRRAYPLIYRDWQESEGFVFNEAGQLSAEFSAWLDSVSPHSSGSG